MLQHERAIHTVPRRPFVRLMEHSRYESRASIEQLRKFVFRQNRIGAELQLDLGSRLGPIAHLKHLVSG